MSSTTAPAPFLLMRGRRRSFRLWLVEWLNRGRRRVVDPRLTNPGWSLPGQQ